MNKRAFLIGAGGAGMSAIAKYLHAEGYTVLGSDSTHSPVIKDLEENYGFIYTGDHDASNIRIDIGLVVYTPAVGPGNVEYDKAVLLGIDMFSYPEYLGVISKNKKTIAIAGTNGKTTTTTMTGEVLVHAGLDPTIIVGGVMTAFNTNYKRGESDLFVVEACEYKDSFHSLYPTIAVITNLTPDHLDYFGTYENYKNTFMTFVENIVEEGTLICNTQDENLSEIIELARNRNLQIVDYTQEVITELSIPGKHNIQNAQAASSVARVLSNESDTSKEYLASSFKGSKRRFQFLGTSPRGYEVYDDYAHNPEGLHVLIEGVRDRYPEKHIALFFQPHEYPRTKDFFAEFVTELSLVDTLFLLPIYKARKPVDPSVSSVLLSEAIKWEKEDLNVELPENFDEAVNLFDEKKLPEDTIVLVVGAGDIHKVGPMLVQ